MLSLLMIAAVLPAAAGDLELYTAAVTLVQQHALHPDALVADKAARAAAESAERDIPWLIADTTGDDIVLLHGERGPIARIRPPTGGPEAVPGALSALEDAINEAHADLPDDVELSVSLLRGAMSTMDKPTMLLAGSKLDRFQERIRGTASGVGARVGLVDGELTVKEVFEGSPALKGDLRQGDVILRIDGTSTLGMPVARAVDRIRGAEGTWVTLHVRRASAKGPVELDVRLQRAEVVLKTVTWERLPSGVGVIAIDHFSEQTAALVRQGLDAISAEGDLRGLVLDLRGNAGGSMIEAAQVCDQLLSDGVIVRTEGRGGAPVDGLLRELKAHQGPDLLEAPVAVLVDEDSASASEIVAGALSLSGRAILVGDRTYGKGTVQKLYTVRPGEDPVQLKVTVAEYRLTGGVPVTEAGLAPDVWLGTAVFGRNGVSLPADPLPPVRSLLQVIERPGWRSEGSPEDRGDVQLSFAERVLLNSAGPDRESVLQALDVVLGDANAEEERRLEATFAARGLDWEGRPGGSAEVPFGAGDPPLGATLRWATAPTPGGTGELVASVVNTSEDPLYRARLRLEGDPGLPWDDLDLPLGRLEPGQRLEARLSVPVSEPRAPREDEIHFLLHADGQPTWALSTLVTELPAPPPASVSIKARLSADGDHHKIELWVENAGARDLTGLRLRLAWPEEGDVELLQREVSLETLAAHTTAATSLSLKLPGKSPPPLDLVLDADQLPDTEVFPLPFGRVGETLTSALPVIDGALPLRAPPGPLSLALSVRDEQGVSDLSVWVDGQKVAWRSGEGRTLKVSVPIAVGDEGARVVAVAHDKAGAEQERRWYVRAAR